MSEAQIAEALGAAVEEEQLPESLEQLVEEDDISDLSPAEQKAWGDGWRPQDQFEGNEANWKTAGEYNLYGEMQGDLRAAKAETRRVLAESDVNMRNLNKYHEGKRQADLDDLKSKQRQAVEEADTVEFDRLQTQIDNTATAEPVAQQVDQNITDWNAANPWIDDGSDKAQDAQGWYTRAASQPGATPQSVLAYVDKRLAEVYPEQQTPSNPRRESATMTEQSKAPRSRNRGGKELSMSDLTNSERNDYEKFGKDMFKDDQQFLKSVSDARKA